MKKKIAGKSCWRYIFIKKNKRCPLQKFIYHRGMVITIDDHTHAHTDIYVYCIRTRLFKRSFVQIRNAEQLKFLFCLTFAMIRFNQMSAQRLLACSLARSFVRSLALSMKSFDSGRPHIYNEQFYLFAISFIHVKHFYVVTYYIVAFHFGRPTTHSNYFRV